MTSLLTLITGLLLMEGALAIIMTSFRSLGLDNLVFNEDVVFTSQTSSLLQCAVRCKKSTSCVNFTFHSLFCQGYSSCVTSTMTSTTSPGAKTFADKANCNGTSVVGADNSLRCSETGVKRAIVPSLGIDTTFDCDGEWLVFQRRQDGSVEFYRNWTDYTQGFGDPHGEYWLGLETLHRITTSQAYDLQVDLVKWDGTNGSAVYTNFTVGSAQTNYVMDYDIYTNYGIGNGLVYHKGLMFTTYDADNDERSSRNNAVYYHAAWWYGNSYVSHLNGNYKDLGEPMGPVNHGVAWGSFADYSESMKFAQMKLKPSANM